MKSLHHNNYLFLLIGLITISLLMGISLVHFEQISQQNKHLLERDWAKSEAAHHVDAQIRKTGIMLMEMLIASEALQTDAILPRMQSTETALQQSLAALGKDLAGSNEQDLLSSVTNASKRYASSYEHARQLISQGKKEEATRLINYETLPLLDAVQEPLLSMIELQQKKLADGRLAISAHAQSARTQLFILAVIAALASLLAAVMATRHPSRPEQISPMQADVAPRKQAPAAPMPAVDRNWRTAPPAYGTATKHVLDNCTLERKRTPAPAARPATRHDIIDIEAKVRSEHSRMALQAVALATHDEQRASPGHPPCAKVAPLNEGIKKNSSQPLACGKPAPSATPASQKGDRLVIQVVDTMGLIKAHSNQIVAFIGVMDDIASDTARLAQNAEAARAGAPGHDLTLVAAEVRALAQRACTVANEIRLLIDDSATQEDTGFELVDLAGETINDIVASVKRVSGMIRQISHNPPDGGSETRHPVRARTDGRKRHHTHLVGHMAATAHGMQQKAEQVAHAVSLYKLGTLGESGRSAGAIIIDLAIMRRRAAAKNRNNLAVKG